MAGVEIVCVEAKDNKVFFQEVDIAKNGIFAETNQVGQFIVGNEGTDLKS